MLNKVDQLISQPRLKPWRAMLLFGFLVLGLIGLVARAAFLQGVNNDFLQKEGEARYSRVVKMSADRGTIKDRNGEILAISAPVASIYADPKLIEIKPDQLVQLARLLGMEISEVEQRIYRKQSRFVYLKRWIIPEVADRIADLRIKGIGIETEFKRYYPEGEIAAHVVGFTDIEDRGQEGVEHGWNAALTGEIGSRRVLKDNKGRIIGDVEKIRAPRQGQDVVLSLDRRIQHIAHQALKEAVFEHHARAGSIVVLDAQSGEVLALSNFPSYNPNSAITKEMIDNRVLVNRALVDTYEPGSTLKPFPIAVALETGLVGPETTVQTSPGTFKVGRATIRDVSNKGLLTVAEVLQVSSNVGTVKLALSMPPQTLWEMYNNVGFGQLIGTSFPGEASGVLRPYNKWRTIEHATMSFGHGLSVSLLQIARAYTIFTTGGELKPVSVVKQDFPVMGQQIISNKTAQSVSRMLEMATQPKGTGPQARVEGYRVAGKTGTAHKIIDGKYAKNRYISSFVGYAPVSNPRLIVAVVVDEPSAGKYFGGAVAAPVFKQVMTTALRLLNVPHDALESGVNTVQAVNTHSGVQ